MNGDYKIKVIADGYHPEERCITVANEHMKEAQIVNFDLTSSDKEKPAKQNGCTPTHQLDLDSRMEQKLQDSLYDRVSINLSSVKSEVKPKEFTYQQHVRVFSVHPTSLLVKKCHGPEPK